jgi:MATE family multidrug resistance protein
MVSRHAGSVLAGQLAVMAFGVTDAVVAGRHSDAALAALSVGSAIYISVYVSLIGIVQSLLPAYAELHGAGRPAELGRTLRQTLYLCAAICVVGLGLMLHPDPLLRWAQVPDAMQADVRAYLAVLAAAFAPSLLFRTYGTLNQALGRPLLVTWIQIGSLLVKVPLSVWFAGGGWGLQPMGAVGCAWATLVVNYVMLALALVLLRTQPVYRPLNVWRMPEAPQWQRIAEFARLGIPGGLSTMIEVTSFTLMALLVARLGTVASASHQVAVSAAAMLYMFPLSLGIATSARVSYWIGAGQPQRARRTILTGLQLMALSTLTLFAVLAGGRHVWAGLYSTNPQVVALAATLLAWVAVYHVADATQCVCMFLLRCYRITLVPMLIYGIFLWCAGLMGGYALTYTGVAGSAPWHSPTGFWAAASVALWCVAGLFVLMLAQATRRSR